jgi:glutathione S-transferase
MIVLYGPSQAPYTEKVRRALVYKGLDFELREPQSAEDYKRWSPKTGQLPVLDLHGEHVPDSTDILVRLDALYPEPPLLSTDPKVAGQQRQLEDWADESFSWHYMRYRHMVEHRGVPTAREPQLAVGMSAVRSGRSLRRLLAWLRSGGTWERPLTGLLRQLGQRLDDLVNFLGTRPFFYSDRLGMADLAVYGMLFTMRRDAIPGSAIELSRRPTLVEFMARVERATGG